jgi:hypothetical protein
VVGEHNPHQYPIITSTPVLEHGVVLVPVGVGVALVLDGAGVVSVLVSAGVVLVPDGAGVVSVLVGAGAVLAQALVLVDSMVQPGAGVALDGADSIAHIMV